MSFLEDEKINKILLVIIILLQIITISIVVLCSDCYKKEEEKKTSEDIVIVEDIQNVDDIVVTENVRVDVKGAVKNPGVYELDSNSRVIDQTTTNMIQKLNFIFARNPLKSKEI